MGEWCTRVVRGTHGCGMWKNIRKGAKSFFGHVLYVAGEGFRIRFWYDSWSSPTALKDLYPAMFAIVVDKIAMISDMVDYEPDGGGRSWNLRSVMLFKIRRQGFFMIFLRISHPSYLEGVMIP